MKAAMFEQFNDTKLGDADQRHELWQRMQLMKQFQASFAQQNREFQETMAKQLTELELKYSKDVPGALV
jgi:hypothetical protein